MSLDTWDATVDECSASMAGDDLIDEPHAVATRAINLDAPPRDAFPWLRQMGFGRAGWYSYDWVDNLGRRSARTILPQWQHLSSGDAIPGAPRGLADFTAITVDEPHTFVMAFNGTGAVSRRIGFTLAYSLTERDAGTRLVSRMRTRLDLPGGRVLARRLLSPADGVMVRRQLLNLAERNRSSA